MIPPSSEVRKPKANTFGIASKAESAGEAGLRRSCRASGRLRALLAGPNHVRAGAQGLSAARGNQDWRAGGGGGGGRSNPRKDGVPHRIRTGVTAVKGRCPRPLDDGDLKDSYDGRRPVWWR